MKLIICANSSWNLYNFRAKLIKTIASQDIEVLIVAPGQDSNFGNNYLHKLKDLGCRYTEISMDRKGTSPFKDLFLFSQFLKIFKAEKPNLYLGFSPKPNIYGSVAANICGIPVINNISGLGTAFIRGGWLGTVVKFLYKLALKRSKKVFFQNKDDEDLFISLNLVKSHQSEILPGSGINLSDYHCAPLPNRESQKLNFLFLGRLLWDKGIKEFVEAARLVKNTYPNTRFKILGFIDMQNQSAVTIEQVNKWEKEGAIEYLGSTEDVRPYISDSDCVVLPSYREGAPKALLEASALCRPIITTNVPGCRSVVDNEATGLLCESRNINSLNESIIKIINLSREARETMGNLGRKKMEKIYDVNFVIEKNLQAIKKFAK